MSPPYTTASSPSMEPNSFENASGGLFTQLYSIMLASGRITWEGLKLLYPTALICLASYQIYSLYDVRAVTKRALKATKNLSEHYSDFKFSQKAMIGLLNSMTEVTCAMTAGNKATLKAIERAMGPGHRRRRPSECTVRVRVCIYEVAELLCKESMRAFEEYKIATDLLLKSTTPGLRHRCKSSEEKDEEKGGDN